MIKTKANEMLSKRGKIKNFNKISTTLVNIEKASKATAKMKSSSYL
jgi:hypothetical protein